MPVLSVENISKVKPKKHDGAACGTSASSLTVPNTILVSSYKLIVVVLYPPFGGKFPAI
jgi:hypothetical protein